MKNEEEINSSTSALEKQLENLNKWHEEYRMLLDAKHEKERSAMLETREKYSIEIEESVEYRNICNTQMEANLVNEEELPELSKKTSGYSTEGNVEGVNDEIKKTPRKFLRRGEGIKQRFKIAPDAFNLNKLPPYKYANAHPKLRKPQQKAQKPKAPKKQAKPAIEHENQIKPPGKLDAHEQQFQRVLFEAKTAANSTPEPKTSSKSPSNAAVAAKPTPNIEPTDESQPRLVAATPNIDPSDSLPLNMAWSQVLDPYNIKPITISELRLQTGNQKQCNLDETVDEQLNLFELLEERAKEGSFKLNSSAYKQVLSKKAAAQSKQDEQDSDIIPITQEMREAKILPKVTMNVELDTSDSESNVESDDEAAEETTTARLHVHFAEQENPTLAEETTNETQAEDNLSEMNTELFFEHAKGLLLEALHKNQKNMSEATFSQNMELSSEEIRKLAEQSKKRLNELEQQIALFKESNAQLLKAKQEHEMEKVCFMQQQQEALEQLNDEKIKIEMQQHDERMKIVEERRKLEEKVRLSKAATASAERKEIAKLKDEIISLHAKLRDKEQTHIAAQGRLRSQLRCLEKEQKDLYAEIEHLKRENKKMEKLNSQLAHERNLSMLQEINKNIVKLAENKNITPPPTEIPPSSTRSTSTRVINSTRSSQGKKQTDSTREAIKTMKITSSSFTHLLPRTSVATSTDIEENEAQIETSSDEGETAVNAKPQSSASSPATNSNTNANENHLKSPKENLKVLTRETRTEDGGKEIVYPNGTIRRESGDGLTIRMLYFNGDVRETYVQEGTIKYYYAKTNTWHTTYLDGLEILEFPNGQVEHRLPNGVIEIHFPNNSIKVMDPKDKEKLLEWRMQDGSVLQEMRNGDKLLILPNGQKEIHTKQYKRREYPDGTMKTVFPDGSYETRYSNGRIRLKDKHGNLVMDSDLHRKSQ